MSVNEPSRYDEQALRDQLRDARDWIDSLDSKLRGIDQELEALAPERNRHELLERVCGSLDELHELGAAGLFWHDTPEARVSLLLERSRGALGAFDERLQEIESRRQVASDELEKQRESTEYLEDELYEAELEAEARAREWIVEREDSSFPGRATVMPWARGGEEDGRFRRSLLAAVLLTLLLGIVFPWIELPLPDLRAPIEVPDRFTRLIREEIVPPPAVVTETRPEEKEPEPVEELAQTEEPQPPTPEAKPVKEPAAAKGILAFREKFAGLADNDPAARLGSQARIRRDGETASGWPTRSLVATHAPGASSGINLASLSRDVSGGGGESLDGVAVTQATSAIGTAAGEGRPLSGGPGPSRTDEEIQIVFDRHKAALYRLYNRELRRDPTLQGQMVLRLTIEPDGNVSLCTVQSSDMKAPNLSTQVVARVKGFDFGAKDGIPAITILYPIDFLPAT